MRIEEKITKAAELILQADGLLIAAGAGMGVDSGLPTSGETKGYGVLIPNSANIAFHLSKLPIRMLSPTMPVWHGVFTDTG